VTHRIPGGTSPVPEINACLGNLRNDLTPLRRGRVVVLKGIFQAETSFAVQKERQGVFATFCYLIFFPARAVLQGA